MSALKRLMHYRRKAWENAGAGLQYDLDYRQAMWPTDWRVIARAAQRRDTGHGMGAPTESGGRWCENPAAIGLRFVGWSDDLAGLRHTGWYTDSYGDGEVLRGCVWQLPGRAEQCRLIPGYREGSSRGRGGWTDTNSDGASVLFFGRMESGPGDDFESLARNAAYAGDSEAESSAESQRDWNQAWYAGSAWAEKGRELSEMRRTALALIRDVKAAPIERPAICQAVRAKLSDMLESIAEIRRDRAAVLADYRGAGDAWAAFREGAGIGLAGAWGHGWNPSGGGGHYEQRNLP